jgi:ABC-type multidrug transport system ATPase subunit
VILDEVFNWLDLAAICDRRDVLRDMVDRGLTLITALQDLGTLASVCDAGLMLAGGRRHAADRGPECADVRAADDRTPAIQISHVKCLTYAQKEVLRCPYMVQCTSPHYACRGQLS